MSKGHKSMATLQPYWGTGVEYRLSRGWVPDAASCHMGLQAGKMGNRVCRGIRMKDNLTDTLHPSLGPTPWVLLVPSSLQEDAG